MSLKRWRRLLLVLAGLFLVGFAVRHFWPSQLTTTEAGVVGTWTTTPQADGYATVVQLKSDRTCLVRWLDRAGKDGTAGQAPRAARWWAEGEVLYVDVTHEPSWYEFKQRGNRAARAWPFAIQPDALIMGPQTAAPVTLKRCADVPPPASR